MPASQKRKKIGNSHKRMEYTMHIEPCVHANKILRRLEIRNFKNGLIIHIAIPFPLNLAQKEVDKKWVIWNQMETVISQAEGHSFKFKFKDKFWENYLTWETVCGMINDFEIIWRCMETSWSHVTSQIWSKEKY